MCIATFNPATTITGVTLGGSASGWADQSNNHGAFAGYYIWTNLSIAGGQTTVAVTGSASIFGYFYYEFSGVNAVDVATGTNSATGAGWSSGSIATNYAAEAWVGVATASGGGFSGPSSPWVNQSTGYTNDPNQAGAGYQIVSSTGSAVYSGTQSSSTYWAAGVIALYESAPAVYPDVPQINPGPWWTRLFKPWIPRPAPPSPATGPLPPVTSSGSITLAPIAFSSRGAQSSPDVPQANPGPFWQRIFKPWLWRPLPPVPAVQAPPGVSISGSITLAPIAFSGSASQAGVAVIGLDVPYVAWTVSRQHLSISQLATYYAGVPVTVTRNGAAYNPSADTVQMAFMPQATQVPQSADWQAAVWLSQPSTVLYPYTAESLISTGELAPGLYYVYVKVTAAPETAVLYCGTLKIY